ncbi:MAG: hypothetical protein AB7O74_13075 [Candidatus Nanopelagicales bacterium]
MATGDWIDVPKGVAVTVSGGALALLLVGALTIVDGLAWGWLLVVGGIVIAGLGWSLLRRYMRATATVTPQKLPPVDGNPVNEPPSNVKRLD